MYQRCLADPHLEIGHMQCRVTRLVWLPYLLASTEERGEQEGAMVR